jgi:hypothetical protein
VVPAPAQQLQENIIKIENTIKTITADGFFPKKSDTLITHASTLAGQQKEQAEDSVKTGNDGTVKDSSVWLPSLKDRGILTKNFN